MGEYLRVVPVVLYQDPLLLVVHFERFFAHGKVREVKLLLHDDLVEIDHRTFAVNQDRFTKARGFADCNTTGLHKVHLFGLKHGTLNRLPVGVAIESKHNDNIVDKLRLTAFEKLTKVA